MSWTQKLVLLANEAPFDYCRKDVMRMAHALRVRNAMNDEQKKIMVTNSIETGARQVDEIAEDCSFPIDDTLRILDLLIGEHKVLRRARGGVQNRGRKMKFHYFPAGN